MDKKKTSRNSYFMREYYNSHYEDPIGEITMESSRCKELEAKRISYTVSFQEELARKAPELMELYLRMVDATMKWQITMAEEVYIRGVQDRDRALEPQK